VNELEKKVGFYLHEVATKSINMKDIDNLFETAKSALSQEDRKEILSRIIEKSLFMASIVLEAKFEDEIQSICNKYRITYDDLFSCATYGIITAAYGHLERLMLVNKVNVSYSECCIHIIDEELEKFLEEFGKIG
jgi:hypothetical protein